MFKRKKSFGERLKELFGIGVGAEEFYEELEDALLEADLGSRLSIDIIAAVRDQAKQQKLKTQDELAALVADLIAREVKTGELVPQPGKLQCFLFLGVNGVGKTTSIAKYAHWVKNSAYTGGVVLAAGDTFRAAATEQLILHGERLGLRTVSQGHNADSAAVIFDAIESAKARGEGLVLADTAGRLHNKTHLVKELEKVDKVIRQKLTEPGQYKKILVIDATTGQNGLQQAEVFHQAVGVDAVFLTKYDSTARGGIVVSICKNLGLPIAFVGTGEKYGDLHPFSAKEFVDNILSRG
jgi:fused signal recognition particle receptor